MNVRNFPVKQMSLNVQKWLLWTWKHEDRLYYIKTSGEYKESALLRFHTTDSSCFVYLGFFAENHSIFSKPLAIVFFFQKIVDFQKIWWDTANSSKV